METACEMAYQSHSDKTQLYSTSMPVPTSKFPLMCQFYPLNVLHGKNDYQHPTTPVTCLKSHMFGLSEKRHPKPFPKESNKKSVHTHSKVEQKALLEKIAGINQWQICPPYILVCS